MRIWILLFALVLAACAQRGNTSPEGDNASINTLGVAEAPQCEFAKNSAALEAILARAQTGDPAQIIGAETVRIEAIAAAAASGADSVGDVLREVDCRTLAVRAYGALRLVPAKAPEAATEARRQASYGAAACSRAIQAGKAINGRDCAVLTATMRLADSEDLVQALQIGASDPLPAAWEARAGIADRFVTEIGDNWRRLDGEIADLPNADSAFINRSKASVACAYRASGIALRAVPPGDDAGKAAKARFNTAFFQGAALAARSLGIQPADQTACKDDSNARACQESLERGLAYFCDAAARQSASR